MTNLRNIGDRSHLLCTVFALPFSSFPLKNEFKVSYTTIDKERRFFVGLFVLLIYLL